MPQIPAAARRKSRDSPNPETMHASRKGGEGRKGRRETEFGDWVGNQGEGDSADFQNSELVMSSSYPSDLPPLPLLCVRPAWKQLRQIRDNEIEDLFGGDGWGFEAGEDFGFESCGLGGDARVGEEAGTQFLFHEASPPCKGLVFAAFGLLAAFRDVGEEAVDFRPGFFESLAFEGGDRQHRRSPIGGERIQKRSHAFEFGAGGADAIPVVAIGLVDCNEIRNFDDALLDALEFITRTGDHEEQEAIHHGTHCDFALSNSDCLDEDRVVAGGFAEEDCLAGLAGDSPEGTAGRGRTDETFLAPGEQFHAGLVPEDAATAERTAGIHGEHSEPPSAVAQIISEDLNEGAFSGTGYAGDPDAACLTCPAGYHFDDLAGIGAVTRGVALHQGDGPREGTPVSGNKSLGEFSRGGPQDHNGRHRRRGLRGGDSRHLAAGEGPAGTGRHPRGETGAQITHRRDCPACGLFLRRSCGTMQAGPGVCDPMWTPDRAVGNSSFARLRNPAR